MGVHDMENESPGANGFREIRRQVAGLRSRKVTPADDGYYHLSLPADQWDALDQWIDNDPDDTFDRDGEDTLVIIGAKVTKGGA